MKKSPAISDSVPTITTTTCEAAREISKQPGARIFWRPGGVIDWTMPDYDPTQILEGDMRTKAEDAKWKQLDRRLNTLGYEFNDDHGLLKFSTKAKDVSPFDVDTDAGAEKIVRREAKAGESAEKIAKKYGFSPSFVKEVLGGKAKDATTPLERAKYNLKMCEGQLRNAEEELAFELKQKKPDTMYIKNLKREIPDFKKQLAAEEANVLKFSKAKDEVMPVGDEAKIYGQPVKATEGARERAQKQADKNRKIANGKKAFHKQLGVRDNSPYPDPFAVETDAKAAKLIKQEGKTMTAAEIARKYGFSLSFVKEVLGGDNVRLGVKDVQPV